ncbi:MAG TPA: sigma-70 family RNA polymerase sigma factor [Chloroflexia bacterium]|nr:sigma-70 family RNA polymerase sigma factor [Chloroflexia bacterium]
MKSSYDEWNDVQLVDAAQRGGKEARNTLFLRYRELVKGLCSKGKQTAEGLSESDESITGEDVEQQSFLIFCDLLESWDRGFGVSFKDYLRKMMPWAAVHYVRSSMHYRAKRKVRRIPTHLERGETDLQSKEAEQSLEEVEDRVAWDDHTNALDDEWRRLIKMRYELGLSSGEIAALRGYSTRTVNRELRAATDALREKMQDEDCA